MSILPIASGGAQPSFHVPLESAAPIVPRQDTARPTETSRSETMPSVDANAKVGAPQPDVAATRDAGLAMAKASAKSEIAAKAGPDPAKATATDPKFAPEPKAPPPEVTAENPYASKPQPGKADLNYAQTLVLRNLVSTVRPANELLSPVSTGNAGGTERPELTIAVPDTLPDRPR